MYCPCADGAGACRCLSPTQEDSSCDLRWETLARFMSSSCAPNCKAQKWHDAATGKIRVGFFTAQDIDPGAKLTYDYMFWHAV